MFPLKKAQLADDFPEIMTFIREYICYGINELNDHDKSFFDRFKEMKARLGKSDHVSIPRQSRGL